MKDYQIESIKQFYKNTKNTKTTPKNKLKTQIVIFEECYGLKANSLQQAEQEYQKMFNQHIKTHDIHDLEWYTVRECSDKGYYDLLVKHTYLEEDMIGE